MGDTQQKKDRLITPKEAAERLAVSPLTIKKWMRDGKIKGTKLMSVWRISEEEVDKLVKNEGDSN
ncbi:helix-turn-helix domain-containing protein [Desmospora activa]|uniref:Excisionase family DNA binding protein n=1 Tax=Desmospora activa DSM 45169 TaxID=1121389 RepID=A0A2T4Z940_9BACL|nr:helix-turn-helix domain-containing protein [Desmospora activa]PTM58404.1 excisionase family DNA binding protein [Desmospora activa DSM 45169]